MAQTPKLVDGDVGDDLDELFYDFDDLAELYDSIESEDRASIGPDRNQLYNDFIKDHKQYYEDKSELNLKLRKRFFDCSFALLFMLLICLIGSLVLVCVLVKEPATIIVGLITAIGGVVSSVLVLPKIIGKYLFPTDEDKGIRDLVYHFKDSDDKNKKDE